MKTSVLSAFFLLLFIYAVVNASKPEAISLDDQNIDVVKLSFFAFAEGDWPALADLYSPDYLQHTPDFEDPITWPEYDLACRIVHARLPDLQYRIVDIFASKGKVAVRSVWEYPIDPSWSSYRLAGVDLHGTAISIFRVKNGKIMEEWCEFNPAVIKRFCDIYKSLNRYK